MAHFTWTSTTGSLVLIEALSEREGSKQLSSRSIAVAEKVELGLI